MLMEKVDIKKMVEKIPLSNQEKDSDLYFVIQKLREFMKSDSVKEIKKHKIWMVNSTATGGGVSEMLPRMMFTMNEFDIDVEWMVINTTNLKFFDLTKKIHNFIHGKNPGKVSISFNDDDVKLFEEISNKNSVDFLKIIKPGDIVIIHDPQPSPMILSIRKKFTSQQIPCLWRCHIGLDEKTNETKAAWKFLEKYIKLYDLSIFSAEEYVPDIIKDKSVIIHPSIHPLDNKNKFLHPYEMINSMFKSGFLNLSTSNFINENELFKNKAKQLRDNKTFTEPSDKNYKQFGFLNRPILSEISRWDRLKGWIPLIKGFVELKKNIKKYSESESKSESRSKQEIETHKLFLERMGLVLGGPSPEFIQDDPEGKEVLEEIINFYVSLPKNIQQSIAILSLPLHNRAENALMVNFIQRTSSILIQNSIREGFGLTLTEGMWKRVPCICSNACGLRQQLRPNIDGMMINKPFDHLNVAETINDMIKIGKKKREQFAINAKKRVIDNFLVYTQVEKYMKAISKVLKSTK